MDQRVLQRQGIMSAAVECVLARPGPGCRSARSTTRPPPAVEASRPAQPGSAGGRRTPAACAAGPARSTSVFYNNPCGGFQWCFGAQQSLAAKKLSGVCIGHLPAHLHQLPRANVRVPHWIDPNHSTPNPYWRVPHYCSKQTRDKDTQPSTEKSRGSADVYHAACPPDPIPRRPLPPACCPSGRQAAQAARWSAVAAPRRTWSATS